MSSTRPPRLLHVASGAAEIDWLRRRAARLIARWGKAAEHAASDAALPARQVSLPYLTSLPGPIRLQALADAMRGYDLVLTYGDGAVNSLLAHSLFGPRLKLPPLVHHVARLDGGRDGALHSMVRALGLARTQALVVPTADAEEVALGLWRQPPERVRVIPPGVDAAAFAAKPRNDALPRVIKRKGERFIGAVANPGERLTELIRTLPGLPEHWHLVVLGAEVERETILAEAVDREVGHRVHVPIGVPDLAKVAGLFDVFATGADPDRDAEPLLGAMAAGLPVICPVEAPAAALLSAANRSLLPTPAERNGYGRVLGLLAADEALAKALGAGNRAVVQDRHDERLVFARLEGLYAQVTGRAAFP